MQPEAEDNLRLEIGHVLFIDIVGYSKLLIEEEKERLRQLTDIVLATAQVVRATNEELVRLPTGDGMALVFRNSSEEPARCALADGNGVSSWVSSNYWQYRQSARLHLFWTDRTD
jgi:hypothetical protein